MAVMQLRLKPSIACTAGSIPVKLAVTAAAIGVVTMTTVELAYHCEDKQGLY